MEWTTSLPAESGFYWYRADLTDMRPIVVAWDEVEGEVRFPGSEIPMWRDPLGENFPPNIEGEFWNTPIPHPPK